MSTRSPHSFIESSTSGPKATERYPLDGARTRAEAALRKALDDAGLPFRTSPEAEAHAEGVMVTVNAFVGEALPSLPAARRHFVGELLMTSMKGVAEDITTRGKTRDEVDAWAADLAEMYCAYFERLAR